MLQTIEAVYDGSVFRPDEPVQMEANTRVRIVVEPLPEKAPKKASFLDTALSLKLEGLPPDFSANIDHYLVDFLAYRRKFQAEVVYPKLGLHNSLRVLLWR